jgi:hypothetical protein
METLTVGQARTVAYTLTLRTPDGEAVTGTYTTETLTVKIWPGADYTATALTNSGAVWATASLGTITLTLDNADTADLAIGTHLVEVYVTDGGEPITVYSALLKVTATAGAGTAPVTYCTAGDVYDRAGALADFLAGCGDAGGFLAERYEAAQWIYRTAMSRAEKVAARQYEAHAPVEAEEALEITTGLDAGPMWGDSSYTQPDRGAFVEAVAGWLDDELLMNESPRDAALRDAAVDWTLYRLLGKQPAESTYYGMAGAYRTSAIRTLATHTFRFDVEGDGTVIRVLGP